MLNTTRQVIRYTALSIGFLLFFFGTIHEAQTANDRKAVEGKHLLPASQAVTFITQSSLASPEVASASSVDAVSVEQSTGSTAKPAASSSRPKNSVAVAHADASPANATASKADTSPKHLR